VPEAQLAQTSPALAQRMSRTIGGTGGRFDFPPLAAAAGTDRIQIRTIDISALVIPVAGEQLVVAITRRATATDGDSVSEGWLKAVAWPKADHVLSFEIPGYGLRVRIAQR
jgi:hypothetical protein